MITKIKSNSKLKNVLIILSFLVLSIFSFMLLMRTHSILGQGDIAFHFRRILELKSSILHGNLLPEFSFNQYHGSVIMSLYPYLNLYPMALLAMFIKSKILLLYIWYIGNTFLLFLISYYSSHTLDKSFNISYLFAVIYGMSSTFFMSGLDDFGEITAYAVLPLVIFGCISWLKHDKYVELAIGLSLIIFCHVLTALMALIFVIVWALMNCLELNKHKIINLCKCFGLIICLTSLVWIPAITFKLSNTPELFTPAHPSLKLFYGNGSISIVELLKQGLDNTNPLGQVTFFTVAGLLLSICFYKYLNSSLHKLFWMACIFILLSTNTCPWEYAPKFIMKIFGIFQSPQRFIILAQIILCYLFAVIIVKYIGTFNLTKLMKILSTLLMSLVILLYAFNVIKTHQQLYIILCLILLIMLGIILTKQSTPKIIRWTLVIGFIIFAMFSQMYVQKTVVSQHASGHIITKEFYQKHIKHSKNGVYWLDNIDKNSQFKYLVNLRATPTHDYYPRSSVKESRLINDGYGINSNNKIKVNHIGYDKFAFTSKHKLRELSLPLLDYDNNDLRIELNNHLVRHHSDKSRRVVVNNINKGHNVINISNKPHIWILCIELMMFIVGLVWLIRYSFKRSKLSF